MNTKFLTALIIVSMILPFLPLHAQDGASFQKSTFTGKNQSLLPYRLFIPAPEEGKTYPLVIFLHGSGERGSDNERQLSNGIFHFTDPANQEKHPRFVLAPQCPDGIRWVDVNWSVKVVTQPRSISAPLQNVMDLLQVLISEYQIDTTRIYIVGLSMGGFGTWDLITRFPSLFAAAVPVCGGGDCEKAALIKDIPVWAFHGAKDDVVDPVLSRDMVAAIRKAGGLPGYTEYPHLNHGCWEAAFSDKLMMQWLFEQHK